MKKITKRDRQIDFTFIAPSPCISYFPLTFSIPSLCILKITDGKDIYVKYTIRYLRICEQSTQ